MPAIGLGLLSRTPRLHLSNAPTSRHRTQVAVLWTPHVAPFRGWLEAPDALLPAIQENPWRSPVELFLYLAASAAALPAASRIAYSQSHPAGQLPPAAIRPLAERLAAYVDGLRYEDIDAATVERVKTHVIDVIRCGIGAFDERPVGICREVALAVGGKATIIGTDRRTSWRLLPTEPPSARHPSKAASLAQRRSFETPS